MSLTYARSGATTPEVSALAVPFFTQSATFSDLWPIARRGIVEVVENGTFSHGGEVRELESALASCTGARHVVGVGSGTDALVLLSRACGLRPDDEVVAAPAAEAERFAPGLRAATTGSLVHRFRHGLPEATPRAVALRGAFAARPGGVVDRAGDRTTPTPYSEAAVRSGRRAAARAQAAHDAAAPRRQHA